MLGRVRRLGNPNLKLVLSLGWEGLKDLFERSGKRRHGFIHSFVMSPHAILTHLAHFQAMDMILTGKTISAEEAYNWGLVARVAEDSEVLGLAIASARLIASFSGPIVMMAKEAINTGKIPIFPIPLHTTQDAKSH
jgi:Enoyl-CoA hydratase/isomerase